MFLDAWGSIVLLGVLALALSVALLVGVAFAGAFGIRRFRRRRWGTGLLLLAPSVLVSVAVVGFWAYAVIDHRPHRTLRVSFSEPVTALPVDAAFCSDYTRLGLGRRCLSSRAIYHLDVALVDGLAVQDVSDDIAWTTDATNRLVAFSFRSRVRFSAEQAQSFVKREAARLGDGSPVPRALEWIRACDAGPRRDCSPRYKNVCLRDLPMRVCLTISAPGPGGGAFSVGYDIERADRAK